MKEEILKDIALVLSLIIVTWAKDWITRRKEKRDAVKKALQEKQKEEAGIDDALKVNAEIYDKLADILLQYNATRAYVKQFHNGSSFYSGQKIQRETVSHEKCRPGVSKISQYHDGIVIPLEDHSVLDDMDKESSDFFYCEDPAIIKLTKPDLAQWMTDYNSPSILYLKISDTKTGNTIGLLGINFNHRFALNSKEVREIEAKTKREFERIFDKL